MIGVVNGHKDPLESWETHYKRNHADDICCRVRGNGLPLTQCPAPERFEDIVRIVLVSAALSVPGGAIKPDWVVSAPRTFFETRVAADSDSAYRPATRLSRVTAALAAAV